ncbi:MAG: hypothetical protein KF753_18610 [Caldilineaceae bacterium]|nr:hypothetical protein [Caldilineaceae bacterium]
MHSYTIYGLQIASTLECPELRSGKTGAPDVNVRYGTINPDPNPARRVIARTDGPDAYLLEIPGVARFRIAFGCEIVIDRNAQAEDAAVRLFLLGSALGALLHQRDITPIHGSAVGVDGGAIIFCGPQGHGKSTLAGAFAARGHPLLSDDVCALTLDAGGVWLHPAFPRLNLLPDAAQRLAVDVDGCPDVRPYTGKHLVPVTHFATEPARVLAVYELHPAPVGTISLRPLFGFEQLTCLMGNTYRVQFAQEMGHAARHFAALEQIAQHIRVVRVERPDAAYLLDELVAAISADVKNPR